MTSPCPKCRSPRAPGKYLCRTCWFSLTPAARGLLNRRGAGAVQRLQSLLDQVRSGQPLGEIEIRE